LVGQSEVLAGTAEANTWSTPDTLLAKADPQNPATLRIGRLDLAFVIAYLVLSEGEEDGKQTKIGVVWV
jgi:hypothetical protein